MIAQLLVRPQISYLSHCIMYGLALARTRNQMTFALAVASNHLTITFLLS